MITRLTCSLVGQSQVVRILPGTLARQAYGVDESVEQFRCNYGLNAQYGEKIAAGGLKTAGLDPDGETRIVELPGHPFYLATLFLPQMTSSEEKPHPLIVAYIKAANSAPPPQAPH